MCFQIFVFNKCKLNGIKLKFVSLIMLQYFLVVDSVEFDKCAKWQRLSYSTLHRISKRLCDICTTLHGIALMPHAPNINVNWWCPLGCNQIVFKIHLRCPHRSVFNMVIKFKFVVYHISTRYVSVLHSFIKILPSLFHYLITAIKIVENHKI